MFSCIYYTPYYIFSPPKRSKHIFIWSEWNVYIHEILEIALSAISKNLEKSLKTLPIHDIIKKKTQKGKDMIVISLLNRKGGAGKTTASVNLAAIFAHTYKKRVLLADIDPQANATTYLNKFISKDEISIYDVLCKDTPIKEAIIDTDIDNLKLIPANVNLDNADTQLMMLPTAKEFVLKKKLRELDGEFDYIFIDCPPARNNLTTNALTASNYTILPCEATEYGIDSIFAMTEFISNVQADVNDNLKVAGILFTKRENTTAQRYYIEQFKANLDSYHFFDTEIRKTTVVEKSLAEHSPLIVYGKREEVTNDYIKVAEELERIIKGEV